MERLIEGVKDEKLKIMITSPMGIRDLLMANRREHMIEAPTFFFVWDMDEMTAEDGVIRAHCDHHRYTCHTEPKDIRSHHNPTKE